MPLTAAAGAPHVLPPFLTDGADETSSVDLNLSLVSVPWPLPMIAQHTPMANRDTYGREREAQCNSTMSSAACLSTQ